jgi:hypothetical protein
VKSKTKQLPQHKNELKITMNGANFLFKILNNKSAKKNFIKEKYKLLMHTLNNSLLYELDNAYSIPRHQSNIDEYQDRIIFQEMNRIFYSNYQQQNKDSLLALLNNKDTFVLSEIGSVFGVKKQKSLFGFLKKEKEIFYLYNPFTKVKLDLVYCGHSYGYIMDGSFVAVTGIIRGSKFIVYEMVIPQSGFFLDQELKEITNQR